MNDAEIEPVPPLVEPLTRREREILGLLAEGRSGPEIAQSLTLALSSVKWHIQQLYNKLGVNRRQQALIRAQELGLLKPPSPESLNQHAITLARHSDDGSIAASRHNLPIQVTRFFGRQDEIARVRERLSEWRLVTLTGSGGVGKTRLSLRVAEEALDDFPDGVWFVELAALSDPALVIPQAATALSLRDDPGRPILESLMAFLRQRQALLVLDNCEHLLEACGQLAGSLLRACSRLTILASSREPLGIDGEAVFRVPLLPFPDPAQFPTTERLGGYAALDLFIDRARAVVPDYGVAAHNAGALARICQRLDGIPLALELAAARVNILTADQLAQRLAKAFDLLTSGSRTALPRHRALRATIDWSYQLLKPEEQTLLQRLSVFARGCTLEAAEAVCSGEGLEESQVLDLLASLVAKSMISASQNAGEETRYHQLEMVRQYAWEKLAGADDSARLQERLHNYFLQWARTSFPKLRTGERAIWLRKILAEHENLTLALEWSLSDAAGVATGPILLIVMLEQPWPFTFQEDFDWVDRAMVWWQNHPGILVAVHARMLINAVFAVIIHEPQKAAAWSKQAVAMARSLGPDGKEILMDDLLSQAMMYSYELSDAGQALAPLAECETLLQELDPEKLEGGTISEYTVDLCRAKACIAILCGEYQDAKIQAAYSIQLYQEGVRNSSAAVPLEILGKACLNLGEYDEARAHFLEILSVVADLPSPLCNMPKAKAIHGLGMVEYRQGNLKRAVESFGESMQLAAQVPYHNMNASNLGWLAKILAQQDQPLPAATLSGASAAFWKRQHREPLEDTSLDTLLSGWRERPDIAVIQSAYDAGQAMTAELSVAYALNVVTYFPLPGDRG